MIGRMRRKTEMGRGDDVREATTNALAACQQHAKETAELVAKAVRNLQKGEVRRNVYAVKGRSWAYNSRGIYCIWQELCAAGL